MNKHKLDYNLALISISILSGIIAMALLGLLIQSSFLFSMALVGLVTLTPTLVIVKIHLTNN